MFLQTMELTALKPTVHFYAFLLFILCQVFPPELSDPVTELEQLAQSNLTSMIESGDDQEAVQLTAAILSTLTSDAMKNTSKVEKAKV